MGNTKQVRLDADLVKLLESEGKYSERPSDVIRRLLSTKARQLLSKLTLETNECK